MIDSDIYLLKHHRLTFIWFIRGPLHKHFNFKDTPETNLEKEVSNFGTQEV